MHCTICKSKKTRKISSSFTGFIDGTSYEIFECKECDTKFISLENFDTKIYDTIYSNETTHGYARYLKYAKEVKSQKNPLKYLSSQESTYYPIYAFLKDKPKLEILEIGCGYGYLTYSLRSSGHDVTGIDISKKAIDFASTHFGDHFKAADLKNFAPDQKFDLIIATELIEHLTDPTEFIARCVNLLNPEGKIIVTTPNNEYCKNAIWRTDLPPVHTTWLSKNSFKHIAQKENLNCEFVDFTNHVSKSENKLASYLFMKSTYKNLPLPALDKDGRPYRKRTNTILRRVAEKILFFAPVRHASAKIHNIISKEHYCLGVILWKK